MDSLQPTFVPHSLASVPLIVLIFTTQAFTRPIPKRNRSFSPEVGLYYQGDIMFMPGESFQDHDAMVKPEKMWPNGIVYYQIEEGFSDEEKEKIYKGIAQFHRDTCIKFKKRSGQKGYVQIRKGTGGCSANAGYYGRRQVVNLGDGCFEHGTILHELMHVIGFHHEQSRGDRDKYVNILWENIMPGAELNFKKFTPGKFAQIGKYDYYSVMHYHAYSFSIDSDQPTVTPKNRQVALDDLGQRVNFSPLDAEKINIFYKCGSNGAFSGSGSGFGEFNEVSDSSGFGDPAHDDHEHDQGSRPGSTLFGGRPSGPTGAAGFGPDEDDFHADGSHEGNSKPTSGPNLFDYFTKATDQYYRRPASQTANIGHAPQVFGAAEGQDSDYADHEDYDQQPRPVATNADAEYEDYDRRK